MPTLMRHGPYRFFVYSQDGDEPPHIHVIRDAATARWWLTPVSLARSHGCRPADLRRMLRLIRSHHYTLLGAWHVFFSG